MSDWQDLAAIRVDHIIREARAEGVTDVKEIVKRIDAAYPSGERGRHRQWLLVREAAINYLEGRTPDHFITPIKTSRGLAPPSQQLHDWLDRQRAKLA